ncbi:hypothetical protein ABT390_34235 [Streptomyces aurantiacus]|uniref:hypothetical protein n=1 Tax=Streptomyces aurantiacus TaxID=47760 RepID=UPI00068CF5A8|nr:hypothetical protein [Streptomyces aurantiacus]
MARTNSTSEPLLSLRTAVVFLIGLQAAAAAGLLTYAAGSPLASAALAGGAAFGSAVALAQAVVG